MPKPATTNPSMIPAPEPEIIEPKSPGLAADGANYAYWREHGGTWADEYDARKRTNVYYHIQELMLAEYIAAHATASPAPLRVLEFGCGVGRHLKNLSVIPRVEVFGHDQSAAMVRGCERWTSREWIDRRITLGPPVGPLPYPDASMDVVYTSEVLVHVRPEHLGAILGELARVARGQVLHFEPAEQTTISRDAHEGCWRHDLPAAYERLGLACETLASGFRLQSPYRVVRGGEVAYTWPAWKLELLRRLDRDLDAGVTHLRGSEGEACRRAAELDAMLAQTRAAGEAAHSENAALRHEVQSLRAQAGEAQRRATESAKQAETWRSHATGAMADYASKLADMRARSDLAMQQADARAGELASRAETAAANLAAERERAASALRELSSAQAMAMRLQRERDALVRSLGRVLGHPPGPGDPA